MQIISYGDPIVPSGYSVDEPIMASGRNYNDSRHGDGICLCDNTDDDCWPVFCGYDRGYNNYDDYCYCDEDDCDCHCEYDKQ